MTIRPVRLEAVTQTNNCKQLYSAAVLLAGVSAADHRANVQTFTHNLPFLPVLLRASGRKWSKPGHEEVETGEGNHVDGQLPQVSVQLTCQQSHFMSGFQRLEKKYFSHLGT